MPETASTAASTDIAIQARALAQEFGTGEQRVTALKHIDLNLYAGEFTLLMGPSGSGKSTLIAALSGLQAPSQGEVIAFGQDLWQQSKGQIHDFRRKHCGFVFQSSGLFPALNALQQIALPLSYFGMSKQQANQRALETLKEVGMADKREAKPHEMSGGQNQRVAIARMLAKSPDLIFCDEPTSALDSKNGVVVADLLRREAQMRNAMILCVTHDERLRSHADRVLEISDGVIFNDSRETH